MVTYTSHSIFHYVSCTHLSPLFNVFTSFVFFLAIPKSIQEAMSISERTTMEEAMITLLLWGKHALALLTKP